MSPAGTRPIMNHSEQTHMTVQNGSRLQSGHFRKTHRKAVFIRHKNPWRLSKPSSRHIQMQETLSLITVWAVEQPGWPVKTREDGLSE